MLESKPGEESIRVKGWLGMGHESLSEARRITHEGLSAWWERSVSKPSEGVSTRGRGW